MRIGIIGYGHMAAALGSRRARDLDLLIGGRDRLNRAGPTVDCNPSTETDP